MGEACFNYYVISEISYNIMHTLYKYTFKKV